MSISKYIQLTTDDCPFLCAEELLCVGLLIGERIEAFMDEGLLYTVRFFSPVSWVKSTTGHNWPCEFLEFLGVLAMLKS